MMEHHVTDRKYFLEHLQKSKVEVFDWPRNSAEMNAVENVWGNMKIKVTEKQTSCVKNLYLQ